MSSTPLLQPAGSADSTPSQAVKRVLIYRLGSMGDTVVALPCLHLIARAFPQAERALLTNMPVNEKAPAAAAVLENSTLIDRYFHYPVSTRHVLLISKLALALRRYRPDVLVYLAAPRGEAALERDVRFFRFCGIKTIYGLPLGSLAVNQPPAPQVGGGSLFEAESHRLARTLAPLGDAQLDQPASWDLHLTREELGYGEELAASFAGNPYIVCAPGCKAQANDWEDDNWSALLGRLSATLPRLGLVLTGAASDFDRNQRLAETWKGRCCNLAGSTTPRQAAAVLVHAALYVGPDSGPMHLAAAVGTPCLSIFSARLAAGIWFPHAFHPGQHQTLYHRTDCSPCGLLSCVEEKKKCILGIQPGEALALALRMLQPAFRSTAVTQMS